MGRVNGWRVAVVIAAAVAVGAPATPAAAHGVPATDAVYYRADIVAMTPTVAGVRVRVDRYGDWLELTTTAAEPVVVLGYAGEPYLRVTPDSAAENLLSETTYLNRSLFAALPTDSPGPQRPPQWQPVAATGTVRWHDHRIHWMGQGRPPAVARDPGHPHLIGSWVVRAVAGATPFEIQGTLRWIGRPSGPSMLLWVVIVAGNLPLLAGAALWPWWRRRRATRVDSPPRAGL